MTAQHPCSWITLALNRSMAQDAVGDARAGRGRPPIAIGQSTVGRWTAALRKRSSGDRDDPHCGDVAGGRGRWIESLLLIFAHHEHVYEWNQNATMYYYVNLSVA